MQDCNILLCGESFLFGHNLLKRKADRGRQNFQKFQNCVNTVVAIGFSAFQRANKQHVAGMQNLT